MSNVGVLQLVALQEQWEMGTEFVASFDGAGCTVRVVRARDRFSVLRYFTIAGKWVVSVDVSNASADSAFVTLARVVKPV